MRRLRHIIMALVVALAGLTAVTVDAVSPAPAGAQSILPCPGGNGGWFSTWRHDGANVGSVNCTIQGNHIVVDLHHPGSNGGPCYGQPAYCTQGVLDVWYTPGLIPYFYQSYGTPFRIEYRPDGWNLPAWFNVPTYGNGTPWGTPPIPSTIMYQDVYQTTADQTQRFCHAYMIIPDAWIGCNDTGGFAQARRHGTNGGPAGRVQWQWQSVMSNIYGSTYVTNRVWRP